MTLFDHIHVRHSAMTESEKIVVNENMKSLKQAIIWLYESGTVKCESAESIHKLLASMDIKYLLTSVRARLTELTKGENPLLKTSDEYDMSISKVHIYKYELNKKPIGQQKLF